MISCPGSLGNVLVFVLIMVGWHFSHVFETTFLEFRMLSGVFLMCLLSLGDGQSGDVGKE